MSMGTECVSGSGNDVKMLDQYCTALPDGKMACGNIWEKNYMLPLLCCSDHWDLIGFTVPIVS